MDSMKVIMIGGTGRCGTNILKETLMMHPQIVGLPFEHRFTIDPDGIVSAYHLLTRCWSPYQSSKTIKRLEKFLLKKMGTKNSRDVLMKKPYAEWELSKWFPNYEWHVRELIRELIKIDYNGAWPGESDHRICVSSENPEDIKDIFKKFLENLISDFIASRDEATCFVEDNTWNGLYADTLMELMPYSYLVYMRRDSRDVACSMRSQRWCPHEMDDIFDFINNLVRKWKNIRPLLDKKRYIVVGFEDFVYNPQNTLDKIFSLTGIERAIIDAPVDKTKAGIGKWKDEIWT